MKKESNLTKMFSTAGEKAAYDHVCKKLLANKEILAWIMKNCLSEYRNYSVEEIAGNYIEGNPEISKTALHRDEMSVIPMIKGENTEDISINEGTVTYDIRFRAIVPKSGEMITLIIDVEAQNDFYPGYPLVTRSVYYCCRMVSAQYNTEFTNSHYEEVKKVYSVFICINPPGYRKNTINRYSITEENLVGDIQEKKSSYDLMTAVIICIGDAEHSSSGILKLLEVLLSSERTADDKKHILEDEFLIKMTEEFDEEVTDMCNLSQGIEEKAIRVGLQKGIQQGRQIGIQQGIQQALLDSLRNLMETMHLAADKAMEVLKIPNEEREKYIRLLENK